MSILIDGDGCPVVDITVDLAKKYNIKCIIFCDTSHIFEKDGATTITCSQGSDSADYALVNHVHGRDIVITQDYGLAAMCLARNAIILNQDGVEYTNKNIDSLLLARHTAKKIRNSGGRTKGQKKRQSSQDQSFKNALESLLCDNKDTR